MEQDKVLIVRLYAALERITHYQTPEKLQKNSKKEWGLDYTEALEISYGNIQQEAKSAIKGVRIKKYLPPQLNTKP